jgi:hypothetical protein
MIDDDEPGPGRDLARTVSLLGRVARKGLIAGLFGDDNAPDQVDASEGSEEGGEAAAPAPRRSSRPVRPRTITVEAELPPPPSPWDQSPPAAAAAAAAPAPPSPASARPASVPCPTCGMHGGNGRLCAPTADQRVLTFPCPSCGTR